ncbi:MAG TPA: hypothetical protein VM802_17550 [Chitinophaga sp.]|uniref:hypothetical protein n=1 Tax=Chitinophaga sp. TaxID=1869181 RepID=UPI002C33237B|nr:hypothetical protein [Chitinophaga sp.]HVI46688.1 hypothetical protein [Chitinophaga sp.]
MYSTLNKRALLIACITTLSCVIVSFYGSRKLQNFDPALIAYLLGILFALFGAVYRYCVWLQRPPTWMYFKRSWQLVLNKRVFSHLIFLTKDSLQHLLFQQFIYKRGRKRWIAHLSLAGGCTLAFAVTVPLTLGWINFTTDEGILLDTTGNLSYNVQFFGYKITSFHLHSLFAFIIFHILTLSSWLVIVGATIFLIRRLNHKALIATQTFEGDLLPLILLITISFTGLGLNFSYAFMKGIAYDYLSVTHAISVILFLVWIPFGKFFHVIQRPAHIGAHLYQKEGAKKGMAVCPHTGSAFATQLHIEDLKTVTHQLGFDFTLDDGRSHLDYSPEGKRALLAKAQLKARQDSGSFFG